MFNKIRNSTIVKKIYNNHSKISLILVLIFILSMFLFLFRNMYLMIDSDMSSELVLAKQLATERKLITTNWYYSTELRVLNTQFVFTPLFMIFDNWNLVRTLGTLILVIVLLLSFLYFTKSFKIKYGSYLAFLVVGSISLSYYSFVIVGAYYIPHIAISFFALGLIVGIMNNKMQNNIVRIIVLCLISLLAGMGGLRQLLILYIPLCCTSVIMLIYDQWDKLKIPRIDCKAESFKLNIISFTASIFAGIGYIINSRILSKFIKFKSFEKIHFTKFSFEKLEKLINGIIESFGYKTSGLVFSKSALILNCLAAILIIITIASLINIFVNRKTINKNHKFITLFYILALLTTCMVFIFTDTYYLDRYILPVTIFFVPTIGVFLSNSNNKFYKTIIVIFLVGFATLSSWYYLLYTKKNNEKYKEFFSKKDAPISTKAEELIQIRDILIKNEAYKGYTSYWTANVLTELSNGKIEAWCFEGNSITTDIFEWLQLTKHSNEIPTGKIFLILNEDEIENIEFVEYDNLNSIYRDKNRVVYIFNSYDELVGSLK